VRNMTMCVVSTADRTGRFKRSTCGIQLSTGCDEREAPTSESGRREHSAGEGRRVEGGNARGAPSRSRQDDN
jgi:hypothetical protein